MTGDKLTEVKLKPYHLLITKMSTWKPLSTVLVWNTGHNDQVNMTWSLKHNNKSDMSSHQATLHTIIDQGQ